MVLLAWVEVHAGWQRRKSQFPDFHKPAIISSRDEPKPWTVKLWTACPHNIHLRSPRYKSQKNSFPPLADLMEKCARCSRGQSLVCFITPCRERPRHRFVIRVCGESRDVCPLVVYCGGASRNFFLLCVLCTNTFFRLARVTYNYSSWLSISLLHWLRSMSQEEEILAISLILGAPFFHMFTLLV